MKSLFKKKQKISSKSSNRTSGNFCFPAFYPSITVVLEHHATTTNFFNLVSLLPFSSSMLSILFFFLSVFFAQAALNSTQKQALIVSNNRRFIHGKEPRLMHKFNLHLLCGILSQLQCGTALCNWDKKKMIYFNLAPLLQSLGPPWRYQRS